MWTKIFILMLLCHIIDDFVLQPVCLSKLKQKSWWEKNVLSESKSYRELYKDDYLMALTIHALSWSIMVHLPIIFLLNQSGLILAITIFINTCIHAFVDDLKANQHKINLITDQNIHIIQLLLTNLTYLFIS